MAIARAKLVDLTLLAGTTACRAVFARRPCSEKETTTARSGLKAD